MSSLVRQRYCIEAWWVPSSSLSLAFVLEQTMQTAEEPVKVSLPARFGSTFD